MCFAAEYTINMFLNRLVHTLRENKNSPLYLTHFIRRVNSFVFKTCRCKNTAKKTRDSNVQNLLLEVALLRYQSSANLCVLSSWEMCLPKSNCVICIWRVPALWSAWFGNEFIYLSLRICKALPNPHKVECRLVTFLRSLRNCWKLQFVLPIIASHKSLEKLDQKY